MAEQPDTSHVDSLTSDELRDPSELHTAPAFTEMQTIGRIVRARRTSMLVLPDEELPADLVQSLCDLAMWAPNHKRTWPWCFASFTGAGRSTLGTVIADAMAAHGDDEAKVAKARTKYTRTPNVLVVGSAPGDSPLRTAENRDAVAAGIQNCSSAPPPRAWPATGAVARRGRTTPWPTCAGSTRARTSQRSSTSAGRTAPSPRRNDRAREVRRITS